MLTRVLTDRDKVPMVMVMVIAGYGCWRHAEVAQVHHLLLK
jgi:hypothetical protein